MRGFEIFFLSSDLKLVPYYKKVIPVQNAENYLLLTKFGISVNRDLLGSVDSDNCGHLIQHLSKSESICLL